MVAAESLAEMDVAVTAVLAAITAAGLSCFCSSAAMALAAAAAVATTTADAIAAVDATTTADAAVDANTLTGMSAYAASPLLTDRMIPVMEIA